MPRRKRMVVVGLMCVGVTTATALILMAFEKNLLYFYSPTQIVSGEAPTHRAFRIGGLVLADSVYREKDTLEVRFILTDTMHQIPVVYTGILPDLFREEQGIVANGELEPGPLFRAQEVLAKHDENYMPPEVAAALKKANATSLKQMKTYQ